MKNRTYGKWITMLFALLLGNACGLILVQFADALGPMLADTNIGVLFLLLLVAICVAMVLQTVIHVTGHLVFGLLTGYRFSSFRIFSLLWKKENGKTVLKRMRVAGTAGQCLMEPPLQTEGKMPVLLYNLGGSMLNILTAVLFAGLAYLLPETALLRMFLLYLSAVGVYFALVNGIPLRMGLINNDGRNAVDCSGSEEARKAFRIQLQVSRMLTDGARLRDLPESWFALPTDDAMENPILAAMAVYVCSRLMDQHRFAEAEARMAHSLSVDSGMIGLHRMSMQSDRLYVELISENRPEAIAQLLTKEFQKARKGMKQSLSGLRTEYAWALLAERDREKAEKLRKLFEKRAKVHPFSGEVESETELLEIAESRDL